MQLVGASALQGNMSEQYLKGGFWPESRAMLLPSTLIDISACMSKYSSVVRQAYGVNCSQGKCKLRT